MELQIRGYNSELHLEQVAALWHALLPNYKIRQDRLRDLLDDDCGAHYVAYVSRISNALGQAGTNINRSGPFGDSGKCLVGFAATHVDMTTFTEGERKGYISVLLVDTAFQNQGIGTQLLRLACGMLFRTYVCNTLVIGSVFPRFWPGVPSDLPERDRNFIERFLNRKEWLALGSSTRCRDLCLNLEKYQTPGLVAQRFAEVRFTYAPLKKDGFRECMRRQRENFRNDGRIAAYEELGRQGLYRQIMAAFNPDGAQVGWALMIEAGLPVWDKLACPSLLGERTGLITCVGVDAYVRKTDISLALVDNAVKDLRKRGMQHVFLDSIGMEYWYERLGFQTWREYHTLVWKPKEKEEE